MPQTPLPPIPLSASEQETLGAFLDYYRAALIERAAGLTDADLNRGHPPTSLTLARLIGHMSLVEYHWFRHQFAGLEIPEVFAGLDWEADCDAEMTLAQTWPGETLRAHFEDAVDDSRIRIKAASSLDQLSARTTPQGEHWNLRWIMVHMIEEYARHCGHADLIRESVDGNVAH